MGALLLPTGPVGLGRPVVQRKALGSSPFSDVPSVDGDPHFIIQVPGKNDTICFNIDEKPGTVLRLIQDPVTGRAIPWGSFCQDLSAQVISWTGSSSLCLVIIHLHAQNILHKGGGNYQRVRFIKCLVLLERGRNVGSLTLNVEPACIWGAGFPLTTLPHPGKSEDP